MKNLQKVKVEGLFLNGCIITAILFSIIVNLSNSNYSIANPTGDVNEKIVYSLNGRNYLAKYITAEDVEEMQKDLNEKPMSSKSNFNAIIAHLMQIIIPCIVILGSFQRSMEV